MRTIKKKEENTEEIGITTEEIDKINENRRYRYCRLSEEIKNKKRKYARNRYYMIKAF